MPKIILNALLSHINKKKYSLWSEFVHIDLLKIYNILLQTNLKSLDILSAIFLHCYNSKKWVSLHINRCF